MNFLRVILYVVAATITTGAYATSNYTECSDSYGEVSVVDGNVTIKDGIGDVGPVTSQKELVEVSENTENCVDGHNYVYTRVTVDEITYDIGEYVHDTSVVLCTQIQTGISKQQCK